MILVCRQMEIQQRESHVHVPSSYPGGDSLTQLYPPWGRETTRHLEYPPTSSTHYRQEQRLPPSGKTINHNFISEYSICMVTC